LPSVIAHTPDNVAEIVVADNGSTDNSIAMLKEKFPSVKIMVFDRNYGFADGYNKAIMQTETEYTVLLNSDIETTPDWIEAPLSLMDSDKQIAAVQPKIRSWHDRKRFEYAGAAGGFIDVYGYPYCRGRIMTAIEEDNGQYDTQADVLWATGACLFVRTSVYKQEGGLDSVFFAHQEEIDLCWRLRSRGYRIVCTPCSVVYHVGGATLHAESPRKTFLNFRNNLLTLYKNLPSQDLNRVMRLRCFLDILAATKFLLSGHPQNALAVFKARNEFNKLKASYLSIRNENQSKTVISPVPEVSRKSLLVSFYLKNRKLYSKL